MSERSNTADPVERAHLTGDHAPTPPIHRYPPSEAMAELIRRFWLPVWDLPPGVVQTQSVLQYPVCLIVVGSEYARFYGVTTGLSQVHLEGRGWVVGVMLQPAAGRLLWRQPVFTLTDRHVELGTVPAIDGTALRDRIRRIMTDDPTHPSRHAEAIATMESALAPLAPIDDEGRAINAIVDRVETDPEIVRVDRLAALEHMSERALQRLTKDRLGLSPKWLIQRRRLHDAVENLKSGTVSLTELALTLGYTDQAHFTRDFSKATGTTPGSYLAAQPETFGAP